MSSQKKEAADFLRQLADNVEAGEVDAVFLAHVVENGRGYSYKSDQFGTKSGMRAIEDGMAIEMSAGDQARSARALN